jgi:ATP-binding cassette subfamily F protein 3
MISLKNISFYFGSRILYDEVSLHIKPKDKIGLIGANGTGKSTLLRMITGEYTPDEGEISKSGDCSIGFLNQDLLSYQSEDSILSVAMQAFEEAVKLQADIDKVLHEMETNYSDNLVDKLTKMQERFEALDGYSIQSKAEEILEGLGFKTEDLQKPLKNFSGGWRMRVMLAKLLLAKPSLLMLDEPTNHLDLPSIQWIEDYLQKYEGAVIIVSHDREFLDRTVKTIVEVSQAKLNLYSGNYSFYVEEKALRAEIQKGAFENQQAMIRQTERFIERFKAKATKARQVQSRVKALERMELLEDVVDETAKVKFRFNFKTQPGKNIFNLRDVSKSYGPLKILEKTNALVERGDKIALIGANGKGKSTLLRIIAGTEPIEGERSLGHNVKFSFFAQHQLESLNLNNDLIQELKDLGTDKTEMDIRTILGCFLFSSDDQFKKIKVLSGGEKSRVALAKTLISESNFLLLDEPTNHLDIQSVNILIQALQQYEGTFVVISHDRHFVSQVATKIWYIEDHEIKEYPGTYGEYNRWRATREAEIKKNTTPISVGKPSKPVEVPIKKDNSTNNSSKELKDIKGKLEKVEKKINDLEKLKKDLENELAKPSVYGNITLLSETNQKYDKVTQELESENSLWESLMEQAETIEKR